MALKEKDITERLPPYTKVDFSTFVRVDKKCRFVDEKYGEFWMVPYAAMRGSGHPKRGMENAKRKKSLPIEEVKKRLNPAVILLEETYVNTNTEASFVDSELGNFTMLPNNAMKGLRHPNYHRNRLPNGKNVTEYAREYNLLDYTTANSIYRTHGPEAAQRYIEQYKKTTSNLEINFCKNLKDSGLDAELSNKASGVMTDKDGYYRPDLIIKNGDKVVYVDVDGLYWHSAGQMIAKGTAIEYHMEKAKRYKEASKMLLQFREDEVNNSLPIVKSIIAAKLGLVNIFYARQLEIKNVSVSAARDFLIANHLMGYARAKTIGLYNGEELVSLISYKKYKDGVDISRFCNKLNTSVVGGLSRLLKEIERRESPKFIQSFVDLRYGTGDSLIGLGFTLEKVTLGWKWTDFIHTYNRLQCRANMDERKLSEKAHAEELGWYRIYDAGQAKFVKKIK